MGTIDMATIAGNDFLSEQPNPFLDSNFLAEIERRTEEFTSGRLVAPTWEETKKIILG